MEEIVSWFDSGKDYHGGVALYERFGSNKLLLRNFKRIDSASNKSKLEYELSKYLPKEENIQPKAAPMQKMSKPSIDVNQMVDFQVKEYESKQTDLIKQLPEELLPVLFRANLVWRENCILKLKLNALPDEAEAEALKIQTAIDSNWKENKLCWKQIDYYLEHKQLPKESKSAFDGLTPAELVKRQQYHFQNISKLKGRIKENRKVLSTSTDVKTKARLERTIAKQESDLLIKETELQTLTNLVNGKQ